MRVNIKGALSGWVIKHQSELFLPDLRNPLNLEGVDVVVVGQDKTSLSWMGVPLIGSHVKGIMAIASYSPNAFTRNDMELLVAIAQRAAHALDNAYHHASVKEQARLDSLTGVLNHGSFIQALARYAEDAVAMKLPLALIMIDIDHFKKYNDTYGHQLGDDVLINLCKVIRANIKKTDEVGRWGGEEFGVILPNTNAEQVLQIAQRIRTALAQVTLSNDTHKNIPAPTVSQGVALLPYETDNTHILIDLADKRLFIAKDRGRDQIEFPLIDSIVKP
jgi:diguanylate cyclase (GGDEF)-like protein